MPGPPAPRRKEVWAAQHGPARLGLGLGDRLADDGCVMSTSDTKPARGVSGSSCRSEASEGRCLV